VAAHPSQAVQAAREAFGARLRAIRESAALTGRELADLAGWHSSKVSKLEHAVRFPSVEDVRAWCVHCSAMAQLPDLLASLSTVEGMYVEWRRVEQTGLRQLQESYVSLYEGTRQFRIYQPGVIPGLFQTPAYAAARLRRIAEFTGLPDDVDDAVAARIARQRVLETGGRRVVAVLEAASLFSRIGSVDMMVGQLGHLIAVASLPNVSLGIIPPNVERVMWSSPGFWIFDDGPVLIETPTAELRVTQPSEVNVYARTFDELASMALRGASARALIMDAMDRIGE
jgi:transcriptional regulator with XRE-family HTH domain